MVPIYVLSVVGSGPLSLICTRAICYLCLCLCLSVQRCRTFCKRTFVGTENTHRETERESSRESRENAAQCATLQHQNDKQQKRTGERTNRNNFSAPQFPIEKTTARRPAAGCGPGQRRRDAAPPCKTTPVKGSSFRVASSCRCRIHS